MIARTLFNSILLLGIGLSFGESLHARIKKPNIIVILADDLGYGDLGCYGQKQIATPNLDRLAKSGVRFTQAYAGSTVCAPSRSSLITGLHTGHTPIRGNKKVDDESDLPLPSDVENAPTILRKAGYTTAIIGKWGLGGPGSSGEPARQGFDYAFGYLSHWKAHRQYPTHLWKNGTRVPLKGNTGYEGKSYANDLFTREALQFIQQHKDQPFFLYLPYATPHVDLVVPEDSLSQYRGHFPEKPYEHTYWAIQKTPRAAYAAMVSRLDRDVGEILALIAKLKIEKNTLVIFTSDNGPERVGGGDPEFFQSSGPLRGIKRDLYEGGIRVPFIAWWPGKIKAGKVNDQVLAFWDLLPTFAEIAEVAPPAHLDGVSMLPAFLGKPQKNHEYLYWEFHERGFQQAVRLFNWKGVRLGKNAPLELYDLETDLAERTNVAIDHPEIIARIEQITRTARSDSKDFPVQ
ncbi:MAG: arylsulfatase [Acidobacteria bacterium]|nr:arylsulfatase [Acidobacteriota bacterium]MCI0621991.1 arylsulfatase [Acidobacteriota bacterium]